MRKLLRHDKARIVALVTLIGVALVVPFAAHSHQSANERLLHTLGIGLSMQGDPGSVARPRAGVADRANPPPRRTGKPKQLHLTRAHSAVFDVRWLRSTVIKRERPEHPAPGEPSGVAGADPDATLAAPTAALPAQLDQRTMRKSSASAAAAPPPLTTFDGLDFANWGAGHPPDTNGDVGPTYYIQTINTSIGIYDKSNGNRVAAFTFDAFMSQGNFGNLCDTDNFGDPVVLYDSFEDRWIITDFAFKLDASGNVNPQTVYQCFAVSKTGDPVDGRLELLLDRDSRRARRLPEVRRLAGRHLHVGEHVRLQRRRVVLQVTTSWAINKQQMYAGAPTAQVVDFAGDASDFTVLPANARLQAGTPPAGSPDTSSRPVQFLNALSIYKFHVDWNNVSTSTFTGPALQLAPTCGDASVRRMPRRRRTLDTLAIRADGAEPVLEHRRRRVALGRAHGRRGEARRTRPATRRHRHATVRCYQANVTGGTVAANTVQGATFDPDAANTFFRFMPSLAVDRVGDMAIGYSKSNSTTNPQIKYAGRLAGDPVNTLAQTEQTLIDGTGSQTETAAAPPASAGATTARWRSTRTAARSGTPTSTTPRDGPRPSHAHRLVPVPGLHPVGNGTLVGRR